MLANFVNISATRFTLNGIEYHKVYLPVKVGESHIKLVNAYDSKFTLMASTSFDQIQVDDTTYATINEVMAALNPVVFSNQSSGGGSSETEALIIRVSGTGQNYYYTPDEFTTASRGAKLLEVINGAASGDLILVYPGTYDTRIPINKNLNIHFFRGAKLIYTGAESGMIYDGAIGDLIFNITGNGEFDNQASVVSDAVLITNSTKLNIEGDLLKSVGVAIRTRSTNGDGGVVNSTFKKYDSIDGTFDNVGATSTMNIYGDYAISENYVIENDGGETNFFVKYAETSFDHIVTRATDGNINIFKSVLKCDGAEPIVNFSVASDLVLHDVTVISTQDEVIIGKYEGNYTHVKGGQTFEGSDVKKIKDKSAAYSLLAQDNKSLLRINSASSVTVTVPKNTTTSIPIGFSVVVKRKGVGAVLIAPATDVTIEYPTGFDLEISQQYDAVELVKEDTDTWGIYGALKPTA